MRWLGSRLHQMNLFMRLATLGAAMVLAVIGVAIYVSQEATRSLEKNIMAERLTVAKASAQVLDEMLSRAALELQGTARLVGPTLDTPEKTQTGLLLWKSLAKGDSAFSILAVVDAQGNLLASVPEGSLPPKSKSLEMITAVARAGELSGQNPFITPAFLDPVESNSRVAMIVPVLPEVGGHRPSLVGIMNPNDPVHSPIPRILASIVALAKTGHGDILDSQGRVLASTETNSLLTPGDHPPFYRALQGTSLPTVQIVPHREGDAPPDENHVMAYVPLTRAPWVLTLGGSEHETFAPVRQFQERIYWLAGVVLVLTVAAGLVGSARLVRPVLALSGAARRMAEGDLKKPIGINEGGEIGNLAEDMERMRVRLAASLEQIQELNQELEKRIAARTRELEQRTRELESASAIAEKVTSFIHLQEVLNHTLDSVGEATRQDSVAIFLYDRDRAKLNLTASRGLPPGFTVSEWAIAPGECLCGKVAITGQPSNIADALSVPAKDQPGCVSHGYRCVAAFPLPSRERVEGVLTIFSTQANSLNEQDFRIVTLICRQIGIAIQNARLYAEVDERKILANQLLEKIINAQEEERKRLARELHDDTGQALTAIALSLETLKTSLPAEREVARERVESLGQMAQGALAELRKMIHALRPSVLDELGLVPAVRRYAEQHLEPLGIEVEIEAKDMDATLEPHVLTLFFRIAQEAINNIARHSKARHATISFWQESGELRVSVVDDGVGFTAKVASGKDTLHKGLGLLGMQERASLMRGHVSIESSPGQGTRVLVRVPYTREGTRL